MVYQEVLDLPNTTSKPCSLSFHLGVVNKRYKPLKVFSPLLASLTFIYICTVNNTPNLTNVWLIEPNQPTNKLWIRSQWVVKKSEEWRCLISDLVVQGSLPYSNFITTTFHLALSSWLNSWLTALLSQRLLKRWTVH